MGSVIIGPNGPSRMFHVSSAAGEPTSSLLRLFAPRLNCDLLVPGRGGSEGRLLRSHGNVARRGSVGRLVLQTLKRCVMATGMARMDRLSP